MSDIILSQFAAGKIVDYIFAEKPSDLIPFKGEFPLLPKWRFEEYFEILHTKTYFDEAPDWMQVALVAGDQICSIDTRFRKWLKNNGGVDGFKKLDKGEKATLLVKFLDENCLGLDSLQIN